MNANAVKAALCEQVLTHGAVLCILDANLPIESLLAGGGGRGGGGGRVVVVVVVVWWWWSWWWWLDTVCGDVEGLFPSSAKAVNATLR